MTNTEQDFSRHGVYVIDIASGIRLTLVGMGTAFALLLLLMLAICIVGWIVRRTGHIDPTALEGQTDINARDKALAAVVAVSWSLARIDPEK